MNSKQGGILMIIIGVVVGGILFINSLPGDPDKADPPAEVADATVAKPIIDRIIASLHPMDNTDVFDLDDEEHATVVTWDSKLRQFKILRNRIMYLDEGGTGMLSYVGRVSSEDSAQAFFNKYPSISDQEEYVKLLIRIDRAL